MTVRTTHTLGSEKKMKKSMAGSFVLGGASSGKSVWAEHRVKSFGGSMTYLATGRIYDAEVKARVEMHKNRRGTDWRTIEAPVDLVAPLAALTADDAVLIDCATMWLTNLMMDEADLEVAQDGLITALRGCAAPWVIVSNEVGHGIVPDNALARRFREAQGRLNIALAAEAALAVQVTAGLPLVLKGAL